MSNWMIDWLRAWEKATRPADEMSTPCQTCNHPNPDWISCSPTDRKWVCSECYDPVEFYKATREAEVLRELTRK